MIEIPLKLSSGFKTKKQEPSHKVVHVVHDSPSVLEQNQTTDLFFYPKLHRSMCSWLFLLMSWC